MELYPLPLERLQDRLDYKFVNMQYLQTALTHSSYAHEVNSRNNTQDPISYNERLEFLGDSVLSIIVSEYLFTHFSDCPEGELTKMRADVVCERALSKYADEIELGNYLRLGHGEEKNGGRTRRSILADAFEALLAAIYLDAGAEDGMQSVASFLLPMVKSAMDALPEMGGVRIDSKSRLQEFIQQDREQKEVLEYRLVGESGPDHNKTFTVDLYLGANCIGSGKGHSKKAAEQAAAKAALSLFGLI